MSVDGNWKITVNSPMGAQKVDLALKADGGTLTGSGTGPGGEAQTIADGKVDGDKVSWKADISQPMPMTLEFNGTVSGDTMAGDVKAGNFGSFPFTGERA
jgi:hypothetical protein